MTGVQTCALPISRNAHLADFLIFHQMGISCRELPVEDVEGCLMYVRHHGPNLNPNDPSDREQLAHYVAQFFADPGRKFKTETARLGEALADERKSSVEFREEMEKRLDAISKNHGNALADKDATIGQLTQQMRQMEERAQRQEARRKAMVVLVCLGLIELLVLLLVNAHGAGQNLVQKVTDSWVLFAAVPVVVLIGGGAWIGEEGLRLLPWPWSSIFRDRA